MARIGVFPGLFCKRMQMPSRLGTCRVARFSEAIRR
jgi:hypothetical protein